MKKEVHPVVIGVVIVVVVVGLGFFLSRAMKPAYYLPSPGVAGRPATGVPSYAKAPGDATPPGGEGRTTPVVPPSGSTPGNPGSLKHNQ
jgi:hypothetical protein